MNINAVTNDGANILDYLLTLENSYITIQSNINGSNKLDVIQLGTATNNTTYVAFVASFNNGGFSNFNINDKAVISIVRKDGTDGSSGTSGINGATGPAGSSFIPTLSPTETFRGQTHRNYSTTIDTYGGVVTSTSASNLAMSVGTASFAARHVRLRYYASIVQTGRYTGVRGSSQQLWSVTGGFRYVCDFSISDTAYDANAQQFYGLGAYNADLNYGGSSNIAVNTLTNIIGLGNDTGDANLRIFHNDGTGTASKIDLGSGFPANRTSGSASTTIYSIQLYNEPGSSSVLYEVINQETGAVAQGTISSNLPSSSLLLNFFASRTMGSSGGITNAGQFDLMKLGVYSSL